MLIYVVWQNSAREFGSNTSIEEFVSSSEIAFARFCPETNEFTDVTSLTENYDLGGTLPQIAVSGDEVFVAWLRNDSNDLFGTEGKNSINFL